jgi:Leucine-rich repeat (LRR) protein
LAKLCNLARLDISHNFIQELPSILFQVYEEEGYIQHGLGCLQELHCSHNFIESIPNSLFGLHNVYLLDFTSNCVQELNEEVGNMTSLTTLLLGSNQISSIPTTLSNLVNLQQLNMFSNQISTIPSQLSQLPELTHLYLGYNRLTQFPTSSDEESVHSWERLEELYLGGNPMQSFDVGTMTSLKYLHAGNMQLTELPSNLSKLTNLILLDVSNNRINLLPQSVLSNLNDLQQLDVSFNNIEGVSNALEMYTNLQYLNFVGNKDSVNAGSHGNDQRYKCVIFASISFRMNRISQEGEDRTSIVIEGSNTPTTFKAIILIN